MCEWCDHCNMTRKWIEAEQDYDCPIPVCFDKGCIYESQICDGKSEFEGWQPGTPDCKDGSDEAEWFCRGLHLQETKWLLEDSAIHNIES